MRRNPLVVVAFGALLVLCASRFSFAGAIFLGPGPGLTGNDIGGIIVYRPDLRLIDYKDMAAGWCARWGRLSHITSVHRRYGDYVGFVCMDKPWMIH
jgi:hypothetical protein